MTPLYGLRIRPGVGTNRILIEINHELIDKVCSDNLVWKARRARHKKFSFYDLVPIAVLRHGNEIIHSHEWFDFGNHRDFKCRGYYIKSSGVIRSRYGDLSTPLRQGDSIPG